MQALARKVAATPQGAPLKATVVNRANNVDQDIRQALPGIIGPDTSALSAATALKADKTDVGQALQPIFDAAPPVDATPVLQQIGQMLSKTAAGSPEQLALQRSLNMLAPPVDIGGGMTVRMPVTDAQTLNSAKQALDNLINYGGPTIGVTPGALASKNGALQTIRGGINDALRSQVPDYAGTMDKLSGLNRQIEGVGYGQDLLGTGKTAVHPSDATANIGGMTPEEQAAARSGVNAEIYRQAGAPANKTSLDVLNGELERRETRAALPSGRNRPADGIEEPRQSISIGRGANRRAASRRSAGGSNSGRCGMDSIRCGGASRASPGRCKRFQRVGAHGARHRRQE
jgi:hypothetical protein